MFGFLLVAAVLAILCSVCASSRSRLVTRSMCLCIQCTSFRYSVAPLDRLLCVLGHTVVVVLTRVPSQLIGQVVASPAVPGYPMSWDSLHTYGVRTPGCNVPLPEKPTGPHQDDRSSGLVCSFRP